MKFYMALLFFSLTGIIYCQVTDSTIKTSHSMIISSDPEGAMIKIDDSTYGRTPIKILSFPKSSFALRLYDDKNYEWGLKINMDKNEDFNIHALINKDYALLQVHSDPEGARIIINDSLAGITPSGPIKIPFNSTRIKLLKEGYVTYEKLIYMRKNFSYQYDLNAKLQNTITTIDLNNLSKFNSVYLDDKIVEVNKGKLNIPGGNHNFVVKGPRKETLFDQDFFLEGDSVYSAIIKHNCFDPNKPFLYSLVLPGSGQIYQGAQFEGACILASVAGSIAATVIFSSNYGIKKTNYNDQRNLYLASKSEIEALSNKMIMDAAKSDLDKALLWKQLSIGMLICTYIYNIFDAVAFHSYVDRLDFKNITYGNKLSGNLDCSPNNMSVNMKYNF